MLNACWDTQSRHAELDGVRMLILQAEHERFVSKMAQEILFKEAGKLAQLEQLAGSYHELLGEREVVVAEVVRHISSFLGDSDPARAA
jgi:alpha-beta hydrolase superfamily lysophospholipase